MDMVIEQARREKLKVHLLLSGMTNSGKTVSALLIAKGILEGMYPDEPDEAHWGMIGLIDTEHRRASLNAQKKVSGTTIGEFKVVNLDAPYTVERYEQALQLLVRNFCQVVIVDSITHNWEGLGGILHKVDEIGGKFNAWGKVKPDLKRFQDIIVNSQVHVISTVRVKQDYVVVPNEKGQMAPVKVGLKNITKDDLDYEFSIAFRLDETHTAFPVKDNSDIFKEPAILTAEHGKMLYKWSEEGIDVAAEQEEIRQQEEDKRQNLLAEMIAKMPNVEVAQKVNSAQVAMRMDISEFPLVAIEKLYDQIKEIDTNAISNSGLQ
ncbi:AAA family ATPase [Listeria fleischmannii]|uniref:AAA+ ATPase domain-containing protein n=1 Tax=Listeria fleischmannii FSL S10-1203 TaxID=1265822 RepID=W7DY48_9LIST|nr:AAA family ATPase [Listeria fleischmannii]EUJ53845.1 hypothetical protein MCOL2_10570 [Listeria fleischmannii FSL S10-1203]